MPCRDYYEEYPQEYYNKTIKGLREQVSFAESALCAAIDYLEYQFGMDWVKAFDCVNAGISPLELERWYYQHKELDEKHRAQEAEKRLIQELRMSASKKLTEAEKKAIGFE